MLIECPECGRQISDKSEICVQCGYPIKDAIAMRYGKNTVTWINGDRYDLTPIFEVHKNNPDPKDIRKEVNTLNQMTEENGYILDLIDRFNIVHTILDSDEVPEKFELKYEPAPPEKYTYEKKTMISCPYCKSKNTKKISGLSKATNFAVFGLFSLSKNSKQWHCNNCDSDF